MRIVDAIFPAADPEALADWYRAQIGAVPSFSSGESAVHHFGRLDGGGTVEWCQRALEFTGPRTAVGRTAQTYLAHGLGYSGRMAEAFAAAAGAEGDAADPEVAWLQPRRREESSALSRTTSRAHGPTSPRWRRGPTTSAC